MFQNWPSDTLIFM